MNRKKIGIFGGAFDPIHNGHIFLAVAAKEELNLDHVMFVPTADPPHRKAAVATFDQRLTMLRMAVANLPWAVVSSIEGDLPKPSYTINTLKALIEPTSELYLIVGRDQANLIRTWQDYDDIPKYAHMVTCGQGLAPHLPAHWFKLIYPIETSMSSSIVRQKVQSKKSLAALVHPWVEEYIKKEGLYEAR